MANTFELIAAVTVGSGGAATIDFTSIPSTYTDLMLVTSCRSNRAAAADDLRFRLNGNTSSIYSYRQIYGFSGGAGSAMDTTTAGVIGQTPAATSTASTFDNSSVYIPNYAGSTNKSYSIDNAWENNSTSAWQLNLFAGLFASTTAISSISVYPSTGSFVQYSTAYLYGVKNA
jgi:hypothetical protein